MNLFEYKAAGSTDPNRTAKRFTVEEANRALVLVRRIVDDIVGDYGRLTEMQEWMDLAESQGAHERAQAARAGLLRLAERIWACLEELDAIGVELKDSAAGVVDFPSARNGREVRLCWRHGEPRVAHWHEVSADHTARRPLSAPPAGVARTGRAGREAVAR